MTLLMIPLAGLEITSLRGVLCWAAECRAVIRDLSCHPLGGGLDEVGGGLAGG